MRVIPQAVFDSADARRVSKAGHKAACDELARTPRHKLDPSNPNHPDYDLMLFGYSVDEFLAKQY